MNGYSMEVFAEARREGILEDVETRRLLNAAGPSADPAAGEPRWGVVGRGLTWLARLARLVRPGRHAAAS